MTGDWQFDADIANRFDTIARTNIPNYETVIQKCLLVAQKSFPNLDAKIIDVGSAMGHTMEVFRDAGYRNVFGVDNSQSMIDSARVRENLILSETFPTGAAPFDMVIANWTLHFVKERSDRKAYFADIFRSLGEGGILIVSDKMLSSDFVHARYHDFKRGNGLTEQQILEKMQAIEGVLIPFELEWYFEALRDVGFKTVELIDASWCFRTLIAYR